MGHEQLSGNAGNVRTAQGLYDRMDRAVLLQGLPMSSPGSGSLYKVRGIWNDPELLADFAEDPEIIFESEFPRTTSAARGRRDTVREHRDVLQEVARARIHALATIGPTPAPFMGQDLGMSELRTAGGMVRSGEATVQEALEAAFEMDAADDDEDVVGPLATGELELAIRRRRSEVDVEKIPSTARRIAQDLGIMSPPSSSPSPSPDPNQGGSMVTVSQDDSRAGDGFSASANGLGVAMLALIGLTLGALAAFLFGGDS